MTIRDIIAADLAATAFDDTADETPVVAITWDPDDDNISCNAIVSSKNITPGYDNGQDDVDTRRVVFQTADIAEAFVQVGKVLVFGAETYKVSQVERMGYGSAAVRVAKTTPVARAHEGHTKRMV